MMIEVEIRVYARSEHQLVRGYIVGYVWNGESVQSHNKACAIVQVPGHAKLYVRSIETEVKVVDTKHKTMMEVVTQED